MSYVKCWVTYNQWCRKYINYVFEYIFFYYGINLSVCNCLSVVNILCKEARFTSTERCTDQIFCCFLRPKASGLHNECSWTVRVYQNLQAYPHVWPQKKIITVYQNKINVTQIIFLLQLRHAHITIICVFTNQTSVNIYVRTTTNHSEICCK